MLSETIYNFYEDGDDPPPVNNPKQLIDDEVGNVEDEPLIDDLVPIPPLLNVDEVTRDEEMEAEPTTVRYNLRPRENLNPPSYLHDEWAGNITLSKEERASLTTFYNLTSIFIGQFSGKISQLKNHISDSIALQSRTYSHYQFNPSAQREKL